MRTPYTNVTKSFVESTDRLRSRFIIIIFALAFLGACADNNTSLQPPAEIVTTSGSGLAIDGLLSAATVTVFDTSGTQVAQATTDSAGRFALDVPESAAYPLTLRVNGGVDTVTNLAPVIEVAGLMLAADQQALLTPFSTLAIRHAECKATRASQDPRSAVNALTNADVAVLLGNLFSFGLPDEVTSQLLSVIPSESNLSAALLLSSEFMVETLRRTATSLLGSAEELSAEQVLTAIACDLDNGTLDGLEAESSTRVAAVFQLAAAEVGLEVAAGQLQVGGAPATQALNAALLAGFGANSPSVATLSISAESLDQIKQIVLAALSAQPTTELLNLFNVLSGLVAPVSPADFASADPAPLRAILEDDNPPSADVLAAIENSSTAPAPVIDLFTAIPLQPAFAGVTEIQWVAQDAVVCERTGPDGLGWNGLGDSFGSISNVGPMVLNSTFTITCVGSGGVTMASVDVVLAPSADISFTDGIANIGDLVRVDFELINATSCDVTLIDDSGTIPILSGHTFTVNFAAIDVRADCIGAAGIGLSIKSLPVRAAKLTWVAPTQTEDGTPLGLGDLERFVIYHGPTSKSRINFISINDPAARDFTLDLRTESGPRFFEITAVANGDLEGQFSNETFKVIP